MRKGYYWLAYVLLLVAQLLLSNYFYVTPYIYLSILPVLILTVPIRVGSIPLMLIACASGIAVDWLSDGVMGLNAFALIPVAFARNGIISLVFGPEPFARKEDFSAGRHGPGKVAVAVALAQILFLVVYIWADGAVARPLWFSAARLGASFAAGFPVSLLCLGVLAPDTR